MSASMRSKGAGLAALVCALTVLACGAPSGATPRAAPSPAGAAPAAGAAPVAPAPTPVALTPLRVGYGGITASYIPLWMAAEAGAFERQGLDVELVHLPGNTGPQSLVAGQVGAMTLSGFAAAPSMIEGAELLIMGTFISKHTAQIYGVSGVDSPQALRGKRLGITRPGTLTYFGAQVALREWGLRPDQDVALVSLNESAAILAGMISGAADAGVLTDPNSFQAVKQGFPMLIDLADLPADYATATFVTTRAYAGQHRAALLSFLRGYLEGHKRYFDDRAFAIEALRKYARIDDQDILERTYAVHAEKYFARAPSVTVAGLQNIFDDYAQVNPRAKEVEAARFVDASFLQELQREGYYRAIGLE